MNDTVSYRYPWQIKRSKLPIDTTISERVINTEVSSEINSCQIEKNEEAVSIDEIVSPELYPSPSFSNGDLEELERSVIDTERYVDELQFELLKFRHADEAKKVSENQPSLPFEEILKDLQSIADSLEAHKTDYAVVADMQTENVRLREELLKMTEENERLRNQLESLKRSQGAEVESLKAANDEKVAAITKDYEERLEKQLKEITEVLAKERADFATQRDAWNEEKATLLVEHASELSAMMKTQECKSTEEEETCFREELLREINEVQNQAREQAAQLQTRIEKLLINSTSSVRLHGRPQSVGASRSVGNRPLNGAQTFFQPPRQPTEISPQKSSRKAPINSAVIQPQAQDTIIGAGQKRSYFSHSSNAETAEISKGKSLKVAAVPPVIVTSEGPHPLLEDSSIVPPGGKRNANCIETPNSKWGGYSDLMGARQAHPSYFNLPPINRPKIDVMPADEWFDFQEDKSQIGEIEQQSQFQEVDDPPTCLPSKPFMPSPRLQALQPQQRAQPQPTSVSKKRHLFTVLSGNS